MDDATFIDGGFTNQNTTLLAHLVDSNGINLSSSGIGHEMIGILDGQTDNPFILNEYYLADPGTYKSGWINYPLSGLTAGEHTLKVIAWDTYNNSITENIRFVVSDEAKTALGNFGVFPNPATDHVNFIFSSNQSQNNCTVEIEISDISGRKCASLKQLYETSPAVFGGNDELKFNIEKSVFKSGFYFYKVKLTQAYGPTATKTGKLIIR